ncbi:hypothetical protein DFH06DRAFT_1310580 [Mycena polygramma]|nr:hypothetical protein DFH06DRAFT_1310580 [Mycena polygramma]
MYITPSGIHSGVCSSLKTFHTASHIKSPSTQRARSQPDIRPGADELDEAPNRREVYKVHDGKDEARTGSMQCAWARETGEGECTRNVWGGVQDWQGAQVAADSVAPRAASPLRPDAQVRRERPCGRGGRWLGKRSEGVGTTFEERRGWESHSCSRKGNRLLRRLDLAIDLQTHAHTQGPTVTTAACAWWRARTTDRRRGASERGRRREDASCLSATPGAGDGFRLARIRSGSTCTDPADGLGKADEGVRGDCAIAHCQGSARAASCGYVERREVPGNAQRGRWRGVRGGRRQKQYREQGGWTNAVFPSTLAYAASHGDCGGVREVTSARAMNSCTADEASERGRRRACPPETKSISTHEVKGRIPYTTSAKAYRAVTPAGSAQDTSVCGVDTCRCRQQAYDRTCAYGVQNLRLEAGLNGRATRVWLKKSGDAAGAIHQDLHNLRVSSRTRSHESKKTVKLRDHELCRGMRETKIKIRRRRDSRDITRSKEREQIVILLIWIPGWSDAVLLG